MTETPTEIIDPVSVDFDRLNFDQWTWDRFAAALNVKSELDIEALRMALTGYNCRDCWEERMRRWDPKEPATDMQKAYLIDLGYRPTRGLTKYAAARLIDDLIVVRKYNQNRAWLLEAEMRQKAREAKRAKEKAEKAAAKRAAKLEKMNSTPPRSKIMQNTRIAWMMEFETLWNGILADNRITVSEAEELKAWLNAHRTANILHADFIAAIDRAVADGIIDGPESEALYNGAVGVIDALGGHTKEDDDEIP